MGKITRLKEEIEVDDQIETKIHPMSADTPVGIEESAMRSRVVV